MKREEMEKIIAEQDRILRNQIKEASFEQRRTTYLFLVIFSLMSITAMAALTSAHFAFLLATIGVLIISRVL